MAPITRALGIVVLVAGVALIGCTGGKSASPTPGPTATPVPTPLPDPVTVIVANGYVLSNEGAMDDRTCPAGSWKSYEKRDDDNNSWISFLVCADIYTTGFLHVGFWDAKDWSNLEPMGTVLKGLYPEAVATTALSQAVAVRSLMGLGNISKDPVIVAGYSVNAWSNNTYLTVSIGRVRSSSPSPVSS
jgi:hypothetical protein